MLSYDQIPLFFLGANAPGGFVSSFDSIYGASKDHRVFILKGGPGTGKSGLLKRIAAELLPLDPSLILVSCSSDPGSLDAVLFPQLKACVADGTAPHILEPKSIGIYDYIINLGDFLDTDKLYANKDKILPLLETNRELHKRASRYITAAGSLNNDSYRIALHCTNSEKVLRYAASICKKELPKKQKSGKTGGEQIMYLSGNTPNGILFLKDTLPILADKIYVIEDQYGAASRMLLSAIRAFALDSGYDLLVCPCAMSPDQKIDHIIIPELSLAFSTSNNYHSIENYFQRIHARRFTETAVLRSKKQHLSFNKKAIRELLSAASQILATAKEVHDEIETYYTDAMDFSGVDALAVKLSKKIAGYTDSQMKQ